MSNFDRERLGISREVLDLYRSYAGPRHIDVGAGAGMYAAASGRWVVCVEPDLDLCRQARQRGLRVVCGTGFALPFRDGSLDTASLIEVIEHVEDPSPLVREALRVCRGSMFLTTPNCEELEEMAKSGLVYEHVRDSTHVSFFTADCLHALLEPLSASVRVRRIRPLPASRLLRKGLFRNFIRFLELCRLVRPRYYFRLFADCSKRYPPSDA